MTSTSTVRASAGRLVRGLLLLVGVAVFGLGALVVFVPGVERRLPVATVVEALGSDYVVVAAVGAAAVGISALLVVVQSVSGTAEARPPAVESVESAPHPGRAFDRALGAPSAPWTSDETRARLRDLAVETVVRAEGCPRSTAERQVADGEWTDDPVAAAYVAGDRGGPADVVRSVLGIDDRLLRAAAAIERVAAADTGDANGPGDASDPDSGRRDTGDERRTASEGL